MVTILCPLKDKAAAFGAVKDQPTFGSTMKNLSSAVVPPVAPPEPQPIITSPPPPEAAPRSEPPAERHVSFSEDSPLLPAEDVLQHQPQNQQLEQKQTTEGHTLEDRFEKVLRADGCVKEVQEHQEAHESHETHQTVATSVETVGGTTVTRTRRVVESCEQEQKMFQRETRVEGQSAGALQMESQSAGALQMESQSPAGFQVGRMVAPRAVILRSMFLLVVGIVCRHPPTT